MAHCLVSIERQPQVCETRRNHEIPQIEPEADVKGRCKPLANFEASSVLLFAALAAGGGACHAQNQISRAALRTPARSMPARDATRDRIVAEPADGSSARRTRPDFRLQTSAEARAIADAIARLEAGCTAGFVPLAAGG